MTEFICYRLTVVLRMQSPSSLPTVPPASDCVKAKPEVLSFTPMLSCHPQVALANRSLALQVCHHKDHKACFFFFFIVCSMTVLLPLFPLIWREVQVS